MGMIRPLIKPSLSSGFKPALRASFSKITRYFTEFDEVAQRYISLTNPTALAGDFVIEFDYSGTDSGAHFFGVNEAAGVQRIFLFSGGWYIAGLSVNLGSSSGFLDGKFTQCAVLTRWRNSQFSSNN